MFNLFDWGCINDDGTYDLLKYSEIYCKADCDVLKMGMEKWAELWRAIDEGINVYEFFSLPRLAKPYFKINGCFDGCYELCGSLGAFKSLQDP